MPDSTRPQSIAAELQVKAHESPVSYLFRYVCHLEMTGDRIATVLVQ